MNKSRPNYVKTCITTTFAVVVGATSAMAQTGQLRGQVVLMQADGSTAPVANAVIDIYQNDNKKEHHLTTDKEGKFKTTLPYRPTYIVAVSAPNAAPKFFQNVKAGRDNESNLQILLSPGDGRRLSLDDIMKESVAEATKQGQLPEVKQESKPPGTFGTGITTNHDRFRDETTVSTTVLISKPSDPRFEMLGPYFSLYAAFIFSGQAKQSPPPFISFGFIVREFEGTRRILSPRFSNPVEFIVLYDGQRYKSSMNATRVRNNLSEVIDVVIDQIPTKTFNAMVNATTVEIRIGVNELRLTESQLSALREFSKNAMQ